MIDITHAGHVATLTIDDLAPLSEHDHELATSLRDAMVDVSDDDEVKVVVLRSAGADFCAPTSEAGPSASQSEVWTSWNHAFGTSSALYQSLCFSKKITITEVQGRCTGAGSMLVLCSDLTVADSTSTFTSPFAVLPEANFVLASLTMRLNRAKQWMFRPMPLSAQQAEACGLVNSVVDAGDLRDTVQRMAAAATAMPLDGVTMSKMMLQAVMDGHGVGREFDMAGFYAVAHGDRLGAATGGDRR